MEAEQPNTDTDQHSEEAQLMETEQAQVAVDQSPDEKQSEPAQPTAASVDQNPTETQPMEAEQASNAVDQNSTANDQPMEDVQSQPEISEPTSEAPITTTEPTSDANLEQTSSTGEAAKPTSTSNTEPMPSPKAKPVSPPKAEEPTFIAASWQIPPAALQAKPEPPEPRISAKRERLLQRIDQSPEDVDSWIKLIKEVKDSGDLPAARDIFERFLKLYPTSPKQWLAYLEMEFKMYNFNELQALYKRCLKSVLSIDVWKNYLSYVQFINPGKEGAAEVQKAYEYVLHNIGIDREAGSIWIDFIDFLESKEVDTERDKQLRMDKVRHVYQEAVGIPLDNLELIWKRYSAWENSLSKLTAKNFIGNRSPDYMTARAAMIEVMTITDKIKKKPDVPRFPQWTKDEVQQLLLWKQYIRWERNNPLRLEEKKEKDVVKRVDYVYQQALFALRFYPEIWYDYAHYYKDIGNTEKALSVLKNGMEVLPRSLLLHFAYAELCESLKKIEDARLAFDSILSTLEEDATKIKKISEGEIESVNRKAEKEKKAENIREEDMNEEQRERLRESDAAAKKQIDEIKQGLETKVNVIAENCSLVWIAYIRFARRSEGTTAARKLFSRARNAANRTYHVFIASALMEYHNTKEYVVADKLFDFGSRCFPDDPDFFSQYLDYLIQRNDDKNARSVFEKVFTTLPIEKTEAIWQKFLDYENKYGDLSRIHDIERRRSEAIKGITPLSQFVDRYKYQNLNTVEDLELGGEARRELEMQEKDWGVEEVANAAEERTREKKTKQHGMVLWYPEGDRYTKPDTSKWVPFKPTDYKEPAPIPAPIVEPVRNRLHHPIDSALGFLESILPPSHTSEVPYVNIDILIDIIMRSAMSDRQGMGPPIPPMQGMPPPIPSMPMRNRGPSGKGRRGKGGGGRGGSKRHHDDYEDDYQHRMGMPPNQPPINDQFRDRQGKRHRNEPPY